MKLRGAVVVAVAVLACLALSPGGGDRPYDKVPAFDFSDGFLASNGIDPSAIVARISADGVHAVGSAARRLSGSRSRAA